MFRGFTKAIPQLSIFHHPPSPQSTKALSLLRNALSNPYPPSSSLGPLKFDLDGVENPPTPDQLTTILSYLPANSSGATTASTAFLSAHPSSPGSISNVGAEGIVKLATKNPNVFKWPVVVDWDSGRASIGDLSGVQRILEEIRKKRDGEKA